MRWSAVVVLVGALIVVASSPGSSGSVAPCRVAQLRVTSGSLVSEKTEQHTAPIVLTNEGEHACTVEGYPSIALLDSHGRLLPFAYTHRGDQMITGALPKPVSIRPAASAYFAFNKNACVSSTDRVARTLRVALPGGRGSQSIRLGSYPIIDYCTDDPGRTVTVSPIESLPAAWVCRSQGSCARR